MVSDWRSSTWGEEISLEYGKALRSKDAVKGEYRVFGSNGPIGWTMQPLAPGPGVILGRKGAYRGVQYSPDPFYVIDTAYYVEPKTELDMRWLYYAIKHYKLGEIDDGSPIPSTTRSAVYVQDLEVPPPNEQRAIAHILGTLDDKIELNHRMNETLEAIARAIFKSWFVDFDPVRAKANGEPSDSICRRLGLTPDLLALFPDRFQDSELGEIPERWRIGTIDDATSLIIDYRGKTPKKLGYEWSTSGIPAISAKNIKNGRLVEKKGMNLVDRELYDLWMKDKLTAGDILMTSEAPLGELFYLARENEFCLSQRVFALRANPSNCFSTFLYFWLFSRDAQQRIKSRATGTTVMGIRQMELRKVEVLLPPLRIQEEAHLLFKKSLSRLACNEEEIDTLAALRDILLPKLLSGQLQIPVSGSG